MRTHSGWCQWGGALLPPGVFLAHSGLDRRWREAGVICSHSGVDPVRGKTAVGGHMFICRPAEALRRGLHREHVRLGAPSLNQLQVSLPNSTKVATKPPEPVGFVPVCLIMNSCRSNYQLIRTDAWFGPDLHETLMLTRPRHMAGASPHQTAACAAPNG